MRRILPLILFLTIYLSQSSAQWIHQQSGVSTEEFRNVEFLNENTGFVCGWNTILKTTNGGANWINKTIPFSFTQYDISIIDSTIIYCVGTYGRILKSTDGGEKWINLFNDTLAYPRACHFINENTGWIAGTRGFPNYSFLVKTTDGGATFTSQAFANIAISDIYFKDANTGLLVATGSIWRTTNGGTNWYQANYNFNGTGYSFNRFGIANNQYCWLVSRSRVVFKSSDFGENWDSIASVPAGTMSVNTTFFIDENTGWAGIDFGRIFKTTDGGFDWFECSTTQPTGFISDIFFLNPKIGWAVEGNNGNIFKTTTGGCNPVNIIQNNNHIPQSNELSQNYPNPFNPQTKINFNINTSGNTEIKIFDIRGKEVETILSSNLPQGNFTAIFSGANLSSGVYFYSLTLDNKLISTKKMLLIK